MNDIQYFAKRKGGSEPAKLIDWYTGKTSSVPAKGLLQYNPSTFDFELDFLKTPRS